ncbi:MAG: DNA-3-methyladenine glycosylase I [Candidatus Xenobium sp.]|jgi:DNA-3-methyladenine glycosylase I
MTPSTLPSPSGPLRCPWCGQDPLYMAYHDREWGVPVREDRLLFEFLVLEGAQAGLSWRTILHKRENYRRAFQGFDPEWVARMGEKQIQALLEDPGIVRNRRKIESAVKNARAFLKIRDREGAFWPYMWDFVQNQPIQNAWRTLQEVPATTPLAERISRELKARGFTFVGPTIVYAHMQATGMVNDHLVECFRWAELRGSE